MRTGIKSDSSESLHILVGPWTRRPALSPLNSDVFVQYRIDHRANAAFAFGARDVYDAELVEILDGVSGFLDPVHHLRDRIEVYVSARVGDRRNHRYDRLI